MRTSSSSGVAVQKLEKNNKLKCIFGQNPRHKKNRVSMVRHFPVTFRGFAVAYSHQIRIIKYAYLNI